MKNEYLLKGAFTLLLLTILSFTLSAQDCKHQALLDKLDKAMMEKNVDLLAEAYKTDAVRHTQQEPEKGLDQIKSRATEFYKNIPDAEGKNIDVICNGDYAIVRWEGKGTPVGSPQKVSVTGITIYKIVDGKVAEEWEEMNSLSLMMQMGYELKAPDAPAKD